MRTIILSLAVTTLLILPVACHKDAPSAPAAAKPFASSPWKITLLTTPSPPVSGQDVALHVQLADAAGKPAAGLQVKAALVMTTMDMGANEVALAAKGNGDYEGTGKFTMSGPWNIVITAAGSGTSGQQIFPVVVQRQ